MDSILTTIKKMLGISALDTSFDVDVIVGINSSLMTLIQIGIVSNDGFMITDDSETWSDLLGDRNDLESVKHYIYLKTRLMFDPPTSSFVIESINKQILELEFRLSIQGENS